MQTIEEVIRFVCRVHAFHRTKRLVTFYRLNKVSVKQELLIILEHLSRGPICQKETA